MGYHVSGRFHVRMGDGREFEIGAGEVACIQPGHDAWVVGSVPVVMIDWEAAEGFSPGPVRDRGMRSVKQLKRLST